MFQTVGNHYPWACRCPDCPAAENPHVTLGNIHIELARGDQDEQAQDGDHPRSMFMRECKGTMANAWL